jgi:acetoacetyl-CoA synthetase
MLWAPSAERITNSKMARYQRWLGQTHGVHTTDFASLWRWSVDQRGPFWRSIWEYFDVLASQTTEVAATDDAMPGTRWFPGARLNWAQNLLRPTGHHNPAIISVAENGTTGQLSRTELVAQVANLAAHLRQAGVRPGDRVAAVLPNIAPAVVAVLACASVGGEGGTAAPLVGGRSPRRVGRNFKFCPRRRGRGRHSRYSPPHGFQELSGGTRWSAP